MSKYRLSALQKAILSYLRNRFPKSAKRSDVLVNVVSRITQAKMGSRWGTVEGLKKVLGMGNHTQKSFFGASRIVAFSKAIKSLREKGWILVGEDRRLKITAEGEEILRGD